MSAAAVMHERTRELTARYERHAYLVYNVALRTTCDEQAALRAAERAFLTGTSDDELIAAVSRAALEEAPAAPACDGAGGEEATALLRATTALAPVRRAALALADLGEADDGDIARALALAPGMAGDVLARAREEAERAGAGSERRAAWLWTPPPQELWERTYARFHEETERDLRQPTAVMPAAEAPRPGARRRRRRWPLVLALLVASVAGALYGTGVGLGGARDGGAATRARPDQAAAASSPALAPPSAPADGSTTPVVAPNPKAGGPAAKPAKPLTPKELDALRLRELAQLKTYAKRQTDHSLPAQERQQAAKEIERLQRVAQKRLDAAAKREAKLRRELAHERALRARDRAARRRAEAQAQAKRQQRAAKPKAAPPPPAATTTTPPPTQTAPQGQDNSCLYNSSDGTYICPEG